MTMVLAEIFSQWADVKTRTDAWSEKPAQTCVTTARRSSREKNTSHRTALLIWLTAWVPSLLTEEQYRALRRLGEFDTKTSRWVRTPPDIRKRGGALFCDCRYGHVFVYSDGAESWEQFGNRTTQAPGKTR